MLRPFTLPTAVLVSRPVLPVMPLKSTTSQAKNVRATTTISGLAALRKACIVRRDSGPMGDKRAISLSTSTQNLKAGQTLAVDSAGVARYSPETSCNDLARFPPRRLEPRPAELRMALSEIEKLERRYAENPQGLTFAPLAEVHRKNGDVARALELLRAGLTLHPDYIPASIVLGRCHLDLGDLPAAEGAFTHVLSLDGENVIALKSLADITERQYRFDESERWLRTLIAVDRSNDEARDQLGRVEASRRQAEMASSASPDAAGTLVVDQEPSGD